MAENVLIWINSCLISLLIRLGRSKHPAIRRHDISADNPLCQKLLPLVGGIVDDFLTILHHKLYKVSDHPQKDNDNTVRYCDHLTVSALSIFICVPVSAFFSLCGAWLLPLRTLPFPIPAPLCAFVFFSPQSLPPPLCLIHTCPE